MKCTAEVKSVTKKTKRKLFADLKPGDKVKFSCPLTGAGSSRGRTYATYVRVENPQTGEISALSFNELGRALECFEMEEMEGKSHEKL